MAGSRQGVADGTLFAGRQMKGTCMLYILMSLYFNNLHRSGCDRTSFGSALASNLAVVFQEASARHFGPSRADVVHYFSLRDDDVAETQKPDRN